MKFRTFRNIVSMVLFLALGGTCYGCFAWWQRNLAFEEAERRDREHQFEQEQAQAAALKAEREARQAIAEAQQAAAAQEREKDPGAYWRNAAGLRPVDAAALELLGRPVVEKIKDASRGASWKINLYADDLKRFNRIKIDLDRDNVDDETWTIFADGRIERKVSTTDNGTMDAAFRLELTGWVNMRSADPAKPATTPTPTPTPGGRPVDADMFALVGRLSVQEKVKDATKGKPYKINLYSDDGKRFNRAKVDLNRNDRWDESWTWNADGTIERKVAPADDEKYTETSTWTDGRWAPK